MAGGGPWPGLMPGLVLDVRPTTRSATDTLIESSRRNQSKEQQHRSVSFRTYGDRALEGRQPPLPRTLEASSALPQ